MNYRQLLSSGVFRFCAVALCYFLAGRFSLLLSMPPGYATAFYPAAGLALGAMLTYGSYYGDDQNIPANAARVVTADLVVSMLAGIASSHSHH